MKNNKTNNTKINRKRAQHKVLVAWYLSGASLDVGEFEDPSVWVGVLARGERRHRHRKCGAGGEIELPGNAHERHRRVLARDGSVENLLPVRRPSAHKSYFEKYF